MGIFLLGVLVGSVFVTLFLIIETKKLWVEEHLGVKLNWYQRIWFWPQDRKMRWKYRELCGMIAKMQEDGTFDKSFEELLQEDEQCHSG